MTISPANKEDLPAILNLQYRAYQSEAVLLQNFSIPPLKQTLADLEVEFERGIVLKAEEFGKIIGSVRAEASGKGCAFADFARSSRKSCNACKQYKLYAKPQ